MSDTTPPVCLDLPATPASSAVLRGALRALIESCPSVRLTRAELDEVTVAVQEASTNVIRHACQRRHDRRFRVEILRGAGALTVVIRDRGEPYDAGPVSMPDPEELREGGYGRFLMHAWMHDVTLERHDGENVLTLVRYYGVRQPAPEPADG